MPVEWTPITATLLASSSLEHLRLALALELDRVAVSRLRAPEQIRTALHQRRLTLYLESRLPKTLPSFLDNSEWQFYFPPVNLPAVFDRINAISEMTALICKQMQSIRLLRCKTPLRGDHASTSTTSSGGRHPPQTPATYCKRTLSKLPHKCYDKGLPVHQGSPDRSSVHCYCAGGRRRKRAALL